MTTSSPVNAAKNIVRNIESKRKSCIEGREFAPILWTFLKSKLFSSTAIILLSVLGKDSGYRDSVYTLKELGDLINKSPDTTKGLLAELRKKGMINTEKAPKNTGLIITRTLLWNIVDPDELREAVLSFMVAEGSGEKSPDSGGKKSPTLESYHYTNNNKEKTAPPPEPPPKPKPKPVTKPTADIQAAPVPFSNNQKEKLRDMVIRIEVGCEKISEMARRNNNSLNPYRLVGSAIKNNYHIRAIAEVFESVKYDDIFENGFNTWGYFIKAFKNRTPMHNEYDNQQFNEFLKIEEQEFCDKMKREGILF